MASGSPGALLMFGFFFFLFPKKKLTVEKIITDNKDELNEKLTLLKAVQIVLKDALNLIGVNTVERM